MNNTIPSANIQKLNRAFLPNNFTITTWEALEPYCKKLLTHEIHSKEDLKMWLQNVSELEAVVSEELCWRQIKMTCNTTDEVIAANFSFFCTEIQPHLSTYADELNKKFIACPYAQTLTEQGFSIYIRNIKNAIALFKKENIPLQSELSILQQEYGAIAGKMTVSIDNKIYTLQQASKFLEYPNRETRERVYKKIQDRRQEDKTTLQQLYTTLITKRHSIAQNAGFANYRDYKFVELGRFDYDKNNCYQFHQAVKQYMLPLVDKLYQQKKLRIGVANLRPWDLEAEPTGTKPLHPFTSTEELLKKTILCFEKIHPFFADCLRKMNELKHFDLESRQGKAPGGYNCPLAESGAPFIFMNAAEQMSDLTTIIHEGGHAVHSFLSHNLLLTAFKDCPMEMAEVASMAMELFSMDHWQIFFDNDADLRRAKYHQLERVITIFPWIACIDKFQHWVYENATHTEDERTNAWLSITQEFAVPTLDSSGLEEYKKTSWQKQLHLFEVPFYYIEYGIAQLGAIGLWMQYKQNATQTINNYINALACGGTKTLPQLYATAGIQFDFSPDYIKTLMVFIEKEIEQLLTTA